MSDLIRREDAIELCAEAQGRASTKSELKGISKIWNGLKKLPSAEPKTGEWIDREHCQVDEDAYEIATCSHCKAEITLEYPNDNYCPNCGAKMGSDTR